MRKIVIIAAALASLGSLGACEFSVGSNDENAEEGANAEDEEEEDSGTREFVNSRDNARSDSLREHYVDFRFDYPEDWTVTAQPTDGTAQNYVRVAAPMIDAFEPWAFHVGSAYGSGDAEADRAQLEALLPQVSQQFSTGFPDYRVISMGPQRLGDYDTLGWLFEANGPAPDKDSEAVRIYGRGDIVLPPGATNGVLIITLATSRQDEVTSAADIGDSGVIANIFESFRIE